MKIYFDEKEHAYTLRLGDSVRKLTSVSKFLETFTEPFNEQEQAEKFVYSKNNKHGFQTAEEVLAYWDLRRKLGTKFHAKREAEFLNEGAYGYSMEEELKVCMTPNEIRDMPDGVYCELAIPYLPAWLIGTADRIEKNGKSVKVFDIKTNGEKLVEKPIAYFNKSKGIKEYKYFKHPISDQPCDTFQKYVKQLSTYGFFLESLGYKVELLEIEAIVMDDDGEQVGESRFIECQYNPKDIEKMINFYKKLQAAKSTNGR